MLYPTELLEQSVHTRRTHLLRSVPSRSLAAPAKYTSAQIERKRTQAAFAKRTGHIEKRVYPRSSMNVPIRSPRFHIVLYQPQIPNNTGNIGRTCLATGCKLHVVHPIAFQMDEKALRRAGLDYWKWVDCMEHPSWESFLATERPPRLWLFTTKSSTPYWNASFNEGDYLLFGQEAGGVPPEVHEWVASTYGSNHQITLPMLGDPRARSLNLATTVACGIYEALRQLDQ